MDAEFSKIIASNPIEKNDDILAPHLPALAAALKVPLDNDIAIFALAWRFKCKNPTSITRHEWNDGWKALRITSLGAAQNAMPGIRAETCTNDSFNNFHNFVFEWTREVASARFVAFETAQAMWPLLWKDRSFPHLTRFIQFLEKKGQKVIQRDVWQQMVHFAKADLNKWDENSAWPSIMDDFAEAVKAKKI